MKTTDLTHLIENNMPVYPGTEQPSIENIYTHATHGFWEHKLTLFSHIGTHVDAPAHMINGAATLDKMDISQFCGNALVIDCTHKSNNDRYICIDDLAEFEEQISSHDFLLLNTGWYKMWESNQYFTAYPTLTPEAASWLTTFDLKGVGIDTISIDQPETRDYPVHNILLETGIILIENLNNLDNIPSTQSLFSCMPLKFVDADGSPVRAFAMHD